MVGDLVKRVEHVLRDSAATSEAERRLAPEAMQALIDAGILRALLPAAYGGAELGLIPGIQLVEELSYIDSAAGWVTTICAGVPVLTGVLPQKGADEMFADPHAVCCGAWFPPGSAEPVQGGYRVTGHWSFASGSNYATWLTGQAFVTENGAPKIGANGMPAALILFFPAGEAEIIDNWNVLGMCGTGSHDVRVSDIFVPEHRVWTIGPWASVNPAAVRFLTVWCVSSPVIVIGGYVASLGGFFQQRFGEAGPIAGAERQDLVVEVVMRVVQHRLLRTGAIADPDIGAGLALEKKREVLGAHARQEVAPDVVAAD